MKKYIAEGIGTMVLVVLGCGTAMLVGCDAVNGGGYILTALAFGLSIVAMAYSIGNISGCHINPAVSLGVYMSGGLDMTDFVGYVVSQCAGALVGSGLLAAIFGMGGVGDSGRALYVPCPRDGRSRNRSGGDASRLFAFKCGGS